MKDVKKKGRKEAEFVIKREEGGLELPIRQVCNPEQRRKIEMEEKGGGRKEGGREDDFRIKNRGKIGGKGERGGILKARGEKRDTGVEGKQEFTVEEEDQGRKDKDTKRRNSHSEGKSKDS